MKTKQYRVSFKSEEKVSGVIVMVEHSTKWFNNESEAIESKWAKYPEAKVVTREI